MTRKRAITPDISFRDAANKSYFSKALLLVTIEHDWAKMSDYPSAQFGQQAWRASELAKEQAVFLENENKPTPLGQDDPSR